MGKKPSSNTEINLSANSRVIVLGIPSMLVHTHIHTKSTRCYKANAASIFPLFIDDDFI